VCIVQGMDKALNFLPVALVVGLLCFLVFWATNQDDTFRPECGRLGGHVYTMDADHRVCIKNGEVILRG
jgi:hypothetical protein